MGMLKRPLRTFWSLRRRRGFAAESVDEVGHIGSGGIDASRSFPHPGPKITSSVGVERHQVRAPNNGQIGAELERGSAP